MLLEFKKVVITVLNAQTFHLINDLYIFLYRRKQAELGFLRVMFRDKMLISGDLYNMSPVNAFLSAESHVDNNCCVRDIRVDLTAS